MSKPVSVVDVSFQRRTHNEMNKPIRIIGREIDTIVCKLLLLCDSKDEKIAHVAMKTLLEYYANAVDMKNKDEVSRMVEEAKHGQGSLKGSAVPADNMAYANFTVIQDCTE
jgi:hypothetical protein